MADKILGTFHDALTGQTVVRELTAEEVAALPEPTPVLEASQSETSEDA